VGESAEIRPVSVQSLGKFFTEKFPKITLAVEIERKALVESLTFSGSFVSTHIAISSLSNIKDFTTKRSAAVGRGSDRKQTKYLGLETDPDVRSFYSGLVTVYGKALGPELVARLENQVIKDE